MGTKRTFDRYVPLYARHASLYAAPLPRDLLDRSDINLRAIMGDKKMRASSTIYRRCLGSLRALGNGWQWLSDATGLTLEELQPVPGRVVPRERMLVVLRVAVRIGDRWATPEATDQSAEEIAEVMAQARADHFYPPAAYDDVYAYCPGAAVPLGSQDAGPTDVKVSQKIRALGYFIENGGSASQLAVMFDLCDRTITRTLGDIGMQVLVKNGNEVTPAHGQDRLVAAVRRAAGQLERGAHGPEVWQDLVETAETLHDETKVDGMRKRRILDNQKAALRGRQRRALARTQQAAAMTTEEEAA